jgi:hypothetical protein
MQAPHWFTITAYWRDQTWGVEEAVVWKQSGIGKKWTEEEVRLLKEHYATAPMQELLAVLPIRTWTTIRRTAHLYNLKRAVRDKHDEPFPLSVSYADWQFMTEREISYQNMPMYKHGVWSQLCDGRGVNLRLTAQHRLSIAR